MDIVKNIVKIEVVYDRDDENDVDVDITMESNRRLDEKRREEQTLETLMFGVYAFLCRYDAPPESRVGRMEDATRKFLGMETEEGPDLEHLMSFMQRNNGNIPN